MTTTDRVLGSERLPGRRAAAGPAAAVPVALPGTASPTAEWTSVSTGTERELEDVLVAAQAGAAWALRSLYETLSPRVLAYLRAGGASEPEDLTSDVFLTVLPKVRCVTGGAAGLLSMVFSVASARLGEELGRRGRRAAEVPFDPSADLRTTPSSEEEAFAELQTAGVRRLLSRLSPDQAEVLLMRLVGDLTVEQIARSLGKTTGAVKQLQRRGLHALRRICDREGIPL